VFTLHFRLTHMPVTASRSPALPSLYSIPPTPTNATPATGFRRPVSSLCDGRLTRPCTAPQHVKAARHKGTPIMYPARPILTQSAQVEVSGSDFTAWVFQTVLLQSHCGLLWVSALLYVDLLVHAVCQYQATHLSFSAQLLACRTLTQYWIPTGKPRC
jgi:hypothetical protein